MSSEVKTIQPSEILDGIHGNQLRRDIGDSVKAGAAIILVDCRQVTFMDSSGLGALVMALKTVKEANGALYLCSICAQVNILFELTGMNAVFQVFPDQAAFEKAVLVSQ